MTEWHFIFLVLDALLIPFAWMAVKAYGDTRARNAAQDSLNERTEQHLKDAKSVKSDISEIKTDVHWIKKTMNGKHQKE